MNNFANIVLAPVARFFTLISKHPAKTPFHEPGTVVVIILARCLGGGGCSGGNSCTAGLGTGHCGNLVADTAHVDATLQPDVAVLAPPGAPAVLDEPVVNAALATVANHGDAMVQSAPTVIGAASKNSLAVPLEGTFSHHGANQRTVLVHHLLHELLSALVGLVGASNLSALNENELKNRSFMICY